MIGWLKYESGNIILAHTEMGILIRTILFFENEEQFLHFVTRTNEFKEMLHPHVPQVFEDAFKEEK